jgi:hypothetical protein
MADKSNGRIEAFSDGVLAIALTFVAMIYAGFLCERCGAYSSGTPEGTSEEELVPYRVMAETAQRCGWLVEDRDSARYDYLVLCPGCSECPQR